MVYLILYYYLENKIVLQLQLFYIGICLFTWLKSINKYHFSTSFLPTVDYKQIQKRYRFDYNELLMKFRVINLMTPWGAIDGA